MRMTRKTYFVNPRLQFQLILGANLLALISVALIATLNAYSQSHLQSYAFALNLAPEHPFSGFLLQQEADFARLCLLIAIVQFVIFNATAIFLSHRIAGPLYRLQRHPRGSRRGQTAERRRNSGKAICTRILPTPATR